MTDSNLFQMKGDLVTRILSCAACVPLSAFLAYGGGLLAHSLVYSGFVYAQENSQSKARAILQSPETLSKHLRTILDSEGIKHPDACRLGGEDCKIADFRIYKEVRDLIGKVKTDSGFMKSLVEKFDRQSNVYVAEGLAIQGSSLVGESAVELMLDDQEYFKKIVEKYMSTPFKDRSLAKDYLVVGSALIRVNDLDWTYEMLLNSVDRIFSQTLQLERAGYRDNLPNGADIIFPLLQSKGKTLYEMNSEKLDAILEQLTQKLCDYNKIDSHSFIYRDVARTVIALIGITENTELLKKIQDKTSRESGDYWIDKAANERAKELGLR